jgi:hypothetical protein
MSAQLSRGFSGYMRRINATRGPRYAQTRTTLTTHLGCDIGNTRVHGEEFGVAGVARGHTRDGCPEGREGRSGIADRRVVVVGALGGGVWGG